MSRADEVRRVETPRRRSWGISTPCWRNSGWPAQVEEKVEDDDYGRFGWASDPEGNRFELWEPT